MEHDGNGHVIRNFYVDRLNSENVGLFGHLTSASVRRVGFAGPLTYVRGGSHKMQIGISQPLSEAHTTAFTMIFGQIRKAVTFGLREAGRYTAQWSNVNNWIGGIGWKPGSWDKVVKYSGQYDVSRSQNSILAGAAFPKLSTGLWRVMAHPSRTVSRIARTMEPTKATARPTSQSAVEARRYRPAYPASPNTSTSVYATRQRAPVLSRVLSQLPIILIPGLPWV